MPDHLCITIRFLDGAFHGRADHGEPEWPPSPLRLYQAIVAASAARWNERRGLRHAEPALKWLEQLTPPAIIAPQARESQGYRLYVPDNAGDLVGRSLSRGGDDRIANYRTEKSIRPMVFPTEGAVHYLWSTTGLPSGFDEHRRVLFEAVESITHIGWGVDLVVASAAIVPEEAIASLAGETWRPGSDAPKAELRAPKPGTFDDLARRHQAFFNRVTASGFAPVPPLSDYQVAGYRRDSDPAAVPHAIFALRSLDGASYKAFDPTLRSLHIAGMLRHAASQPDFLRSVGLSPEEGRSLVLGHGEARGESHQAVAGPRLAFIPLPSIEPREKSLVVSSVRRVLITLRSGDTAIFKRLVQRLEARELIDESKTEAIAILQRQSGGSEGATDRYLRSATTWATVTPVILPGYDDPRKLRQRLKPGNTLSAEEKAAVLGKLDERIDALLRKAIRQAGYSEVLATHAELDWRSSGFWPGTALATQYAAGDQHRRYRKLHVRITWRDADGTTIDVPGPICVGSGKFTGMGLFAAMT
ncbi:type I-U CRISPR-associated protein Csb2 [Prosthecobacter sp.]|uniref:type I-G CRISPR-associated protein Csb2 n=1 Tax=Prosthecobacter sp. TaxID=1965333 RepID=UPI0037835D51